MRYERVHIQAVEYLPPPVEVTTSSLEESLAPLYRRIGVSQGVLTALTGVGSRRFWPEGMSTSDSAGQVARQLVERHGLPPCGAQVIVSTSVSKDYLEPPIASLVAGDLGLGAECLNFDV